MSPRRRTNALAACLMLFAGAACSEPPAATRDLARQEIFTPSPTAATAAPATPIDSPRSPYVIAPLEAPTGVQLTGQSVTYPVTGRTASELKRELMVGVPGDTPGAGLTTWQLRVDYLYGPSAAGQCEPSNIEVSVEIVTRLPEWEPSPTAEAGLVERWDRYYNALVLHLRGYAQNGLDHAGQLLNALQGLQPTGKCADLIALVKETTDRITADGQEANRAYGEETRDGALQGADPGVLDD